MSTSGDSRLSSLIKTARASLAPLDKRSSASGKDNNISQTGLIADIQALGFEDYGTLAQFLNASVTGINDDNHLLLERLVQLLAKLPPHSKQLKGLSDGFINQLWTTLDHPPVSSLGDEYKYRRADGSYNNIHAPKLGAANTPYTRSVRPTVFQNPSLPEPGVIFERLMARGDEFQPHPQGISSMLFYLATIIIHDIFQTSHKDHNVNLASSYLDLSPLYGRNEDEVKMMRTFQDGLLKPDCFSSTRILGFPPGCSVFLVMFNRFHNYVATQLALINEAGRFDKPKKTEDKAAWAKYDEDLFQTGRLVTCGLYINIIMKDYVRTILALNRTNSSWSLDPRTKEGKDLFNKPVPEGVGNHVSAEFNLIYRWHSIISPKDEQWTNAKLKRLLKDKDPEAATMEDVLQALGEWQAETPSQPEARTFENLARIPDRTLPDDEMVKILTESIEDLAGSYGANKVPRCMKAIEVLGIVQARRWKLGTLNEFREFVGLTKHASFEDINPDPGVAAHLRQLYDSPDSVEMYPGIVAEKTKPPMSPGSGLCGNVTMTMAILSDAVALVRGDRFYTVDYTPNALTNWGFNEANYDTTINGGHVMHKLIFRAFPNHFVHNSIYAHFPLVTPSENKKILESLGRRNQFSWEAPRAHPLPVMIKSYKACTQILNDNKSYKVVWGEAITSLTNNTDAPGVGADFCLSGDRKANRSNRDCVQKCLYPNKWENDVKVFFAATSARLLGQYGYSVSKTTEGRTYEVDIVRDVISLATTHFSAALWSLPIKTEAHPHGIYAEQQLYNVLLVGFAAIFFDADIANSHKLRSQASILAQQLGKLMVLKTKLLSPGNGVVAAVLATAKKIITAVGNIAKGSRIRKASSTQGPEWPVLALYGDRMIKRMLRESRATPEDVVWGSILPASVAACANQTEVLSQAIDYYLGDGKEHLPAMYTLAHQDTEDADEKLKKYMLEGVRLRGGVAITREVTEDQTVQDFSPSQPDLSDPSGLNPLPNGSPGGSGTTHKLKAGMRLLLNLTAANHDGTVFPEPEMVRLDRPIKSYIHFGWGPHLCLGQNMSIVGLAVVFKKIVGLRNLRRAPGAKGEVKSFPAMFWNGQVGSQRNLDAGWTGLRTYMTTDQSSFWPLPSTLKVQWDE